ncbi:unnamed protein product [Kuraishia capsulata CBS 1993]|uniref:HRDC domain-containing protein n=1 Tax=Kuraishia capsulata CBS 1993 TaxID=1382522 RepID=W6MTP7_9ASCO|nr:uncharacterized protein KUCA_T00001137001 [Kuraishia capsulata CBS 1993]CDK25170.1 unnamed protein product [Kuraishia capsulata CBS 1993]
MPQHNQSHISLETVAPKLANVIRPAAGLAAKDVKFYKALDPQVSSSADASSGLILELAQRLVDLSTADKESVTLSADAEILDLTRLVGDVLDDLVEKTDIALDDFEKGKVYDAADEAKDNETESEDGFTYLDPGNAQANKLTRRRDKPQEQFGFEIDNSEETPFRPLLPTKPHAIHPLNTALVDPEYVFSEVSQSEILVTPQHYEQPYAFEIMNQEYPEAILRKSVPIDAKPWAETTAIWVDTPELLRQMVDTLKNEAAIAVDLEHHDFRTYRGLTCLIQISNRDQDWLIDPLALWRELHILNEVTADPKIVKVFHGAFMDTHWLQRDFGVYVVSMFDTYHACVALGFPQRGLSYLLERFAKFRTSKVYQRADWRLRPLTDIMKEYARSDTHFLLYVYDNLRNMLLENGKMSEVLAASRKVAAQRFEYPDFKPLELSAGNGFSYDTAAQYRERPWGGQMGRLGVPRAKEEVFKSLYQWRKSVAQQNDESVAFVMSSALLAELALKAPTTLTELRSVNQKIPDLVLSREQEVVDLINDALARSDLEDMEKLGSVEFEEPVETHTENTTGNFVELKDAGEIESVFLKLAQKLEYAKTDAIMGARPRILGAEKATFAVEYPQRGKVVTHTVEDLDGRKEFLAKELDNEVVVVPEQTTAEETGSVEPQIPAEEPSAAPSSVSSSDPLEAKTAAEKDEIITLRKKREQPFRERKEADTEAVDYSKFDKIILDSEGKRERSRKKDKTKPKPIFDPYSASSEGPQGAKKKDRFIGGKSSTYKAKR